MDLTTTKVNQDFVIRYYHKPKTSPDSYKVISARQFFQYVEELPQDPLKNHGEIPDDTLAYKLIRKTYKRGIDLDAHNLRRGIKFTFEWR